MTSGATLLYTHRACLDHDPSPGHPESPARLAAILAALDAPEFAPLIRREAPRASRALIERVHPADFVDRIFASVPQSDYAAVDGDTILSPGSGEAALRAAGALCAAVDAVMAGEGANAFCAVRPPGHHAEPERAMGFCLFNNVAIGALHARAVHGCARVAVVDFDVHHGNGTQAAFERDRDLFFASTHQSPLYPGTGMASERGVGNIVNVPLPPRSGSAEFRRAMSGTVLPALSRVPARLHPDLGRLRRPSRGPARQPGIHRGRISPGRPRRSSPWREPMPGPRRLDAGRRLRPRRAGRQRRRPCARADGGGLRAGRQRTTTPHAFNLSLSLSCSGSPRAPIPQLSAGDFGGMDPRVEPEDDNGAGSRPCPEHPFRKCFSVRRSAARVLGSSPSTTMEGGSRSCSGRGQRLDCAPNQGFAMAQTTPSAAADDAR